MDTVREAIHCGIKKYDYFHEGLSAKTIFNCDIIGPRGCELCYLFHKNECQGCPVAAYTGENRCKRTPYVRFEDIFLEAEREVFYRFNPSIDNLISEAKDAAKEMADFLRGVLKHYDKNKKD